MKHKSLNIRLGQTPRISPAFSIREIFAGFHRAGSQKKERDYKQNREQVKFLQLYNTEPFITVSATVGYIAASTKAFSFDGNSAEISSNVNMYAPFSIHSFLKVLCSTTKCLRRSFNVEVKYFHRSTITFTGHTTERKAKSQRINVLLNFRLNSLRQVHRALI